MDANGSEQNLDPNVADKADDKKSQFEDLARFLLYNPAVFSLFFNLGTWSFLNQFLRLFPDFRKQALPFISIPSSMLAAWGWKIGRDSIKHPNNEIENDTVKRISMAGMEALSCVFPFVFEEMIRISCNKRLEEKQPCNVSNEDFWGIFFTIASVFAISYVLWQGIISPPKKHIWHSSNLKQKKALAMGVIGIDLFMKTLFDSRILQKTISNINATSSPWVYECVAIPAALIVLAGGIFRDQHGQKLDTSMMYLLIANLMYDFCSVVKVALSQEFSNTQQKQLYWGTSLFELSFLSLSFLTGVIYSAYHYKNYFEERNKAPRVVSTKGYVFPSERKFCAALKDQDAANQSKTIDSLLEDSDIKSMILKKLNMDPQGLVGCLKKDPAMYMQIAKLILENDGFAVTIEDKDIENSDNELVTVGDPEDANKTRDVSLSLASITQEPQSKTSPSAPLLLSQPFARQTGFYNTMSNLPTNPQSVAANDDEPSSSTSGGHQRLLP